MAVYAGKRVSPEWRVVLLAAHAAGVRFTLDSGQRTMAEQWALVRRLGVWSPSNPHGAAVPSPTAPHIRMGRPDHALDVNQLDGGAVRLARWLGRIGLRMGFTVPGEPWHEEALGGPNALRAVARRLGDPLSRRERGLVNELLALRRRNAHGWHKADLDRANAIKRWILRQRKRIRAAAKRTGWKRANRGARHRILGVAYRGH